MPFLQLEEIRRKFPKVYKQWHESPEKICPPEGETLTEPALLPGFEISVKEIFSV